jgi:hypothetical protein
MLVDELRGGLAAAAVFQFMQGDAGIVAVESKYVLAPDLMEPDFSSVIRVLAVLRGSGCRLEDLAHDTPRARQTGARVRACRP